MLHRDSLITAAGDREKSVESGNRSRKMKRLIEIRAGEGGRDAQMLVNEQARMYARAAERSGL